MVFSSEDQLDSLSSDIFFSKLLMKSYKYNFIKYRFLSSNPKLESFVGQVLLMVLPSPALALSALLFQAFTAIVCIISYDCIVLTESVLSAIMYLFSALS